MADFFAKGNKPIGGYVESAKTKIYDDSLPSTIGSWVSLSGITSQALSDYKYIDIDFYWAGGFIRITLCVETVRQAQVYVVPQIVEGGTTYRFLIETRFDSTGQFQYRFNILGYTTTIEKAKIYAYNL